VFAQVRDYHAFHRTTFPTGISAHGRHPSLLQGARTLTHSYIRDSDYGDEAYDLRTDPHELCNLLNPDAGPPPAEAEALRRRVDAFEKECLDLREGLGVVPGDRGFVKGWE